MEEIDDWIALAFPREGRAELGRRLEPGLVLADFRLDALLGEGAMGQVWRAAQLSLGGRTVALKFVRPDRITPHLAELFEREARAGGRLTHPGIVSVHARGALDGLAWIAMELVPGGRTLRDLVDEAVRSPELPRDYDRRVAELVAAIADALQVAHDAGVIHRDLKPQNILLTTDGSPKVSDFGLARILDETSLSESSGVAGTYPYMSPEQVRGEKDRTDHRTDVFSLGVILYELIALRRPFTGDSAHQVAEQIVAHPPEDPTRFRAKVPRALAVIAGKALEKEPSRRYASMSAMAEDLRRFLRGEPILARPPSSVQRARLWTKRNPVKSTALGITVVAFVAILLLLVENVSARESAEEQGRLAESARDDVLRLSAVFESDDLIQEARRLWPALPANIAGYLAWTKRANGLLAEGGSLRRRLEELREESRDARTDEENRQLGWWERELSELIAGLETIEIRLLAAGTVDPEFAWSIPMRLRFAESIEERSVAGPEARRRWDEALAMLRDPTLCPAYAGLELTPQVGLLPLGRDPDSALLEFTHLATGEAPERDEHGRLALSELSGLVLVLLPGGVFEMGAQQDPSGPNADPSAEPSEGPVHSVMLSPFFLSKYEMTQAQWKRLTGVNPSAYQPEGTSYNKDWNNKGREASLLHPVESVSWNDCLRVLGWAGLTLPSEARWEYAARAGTKTVWSFGSERDAMQLHGNTVDDYCRQFGGPPGWNYEAWSDGETVHAPVGSFAPNGFGLHDVHGNLWEWCLDGYDSEFYESAESAGPDPVAPSEGGTFRSYRGGGFWDLSLAARSSNRGGDSPPTNADVVVGVRPALDVCR